MIGTYHNASVFFLHQLHHFFHNAIHIYITLQMIGFIKIAIGIALCAA